MAHRTRRLVTCISLAVTLLAVAAAPCAAEWRRLDSPNFVIVGDVGAGTLRDIAIRFEGFRETLSRVLSDRVTSTAVPTIVIVFPTDKAFTPFKPKYQGKPIELAGLDFDDGGDVGEEAVVRRDPERAAGAGLARPPATRNAPPRAR